MQMSIVAVVTLLAVVMQQSNTPPITGQWTSHKSKRGDELLITFSRPFNRGIRTERKMVLLSELKGLPANTATRTSDVAFRLVREAGTFEMRGWLRHNEGGGGWTLTPNNGFLTRLRERGYHSLTDDQLFSAAIANVTIKLVDDLRAEGYHDLSYHEVFEAAAFEITPQFIRRVKTSVTSDPTFETLVALRIKDKE